MNKGKSIRVDETIYRLVTDKKRAMERIPPYPFVSMGDALKELLRERRP